MPFFAQAWAIGQPGDSIGDGVGVLVGLRSRVHRTEADPNAVGQVATATTAYEKLRCLSTAAHRLRG